MNTDQKLEWTRKNWMKLKKEDKLDVAIDKIKDKDEWLTKNYSTQDIIDIEESIMGI